MKFKKKCRSCGETVYGSASPSPRCFRFWDRERNHDQREVVSMLRVCAERMYAEARTAADFARAADAILDYAAALDELEPKHADLVRKFAERARKGLLSVKQGGRSVPSSLAETVEDPLVDLSMMGLTRKSD